MRRLRYKVAMSLDGFIAGADGEYDWIERDPTIDFSAVYREFDTALMGRRTFEMAQRGPGAALPGMQTVVCSRSLRAEDFADFTVAADAVGAVGSLKAKSGKDIWLFGGAGLFRCLLDAGLVDTIEVAVMPILLSRGIPLLPGGSRSPRLHLADCVKKPGGIVSLTYTTKRK